MDPNTEYSLTVACLLVALFCTLIYYDKSNEVNARKHSKYYCLDVLDYGVWKNTIVIQKDLQKKHGLFVDPLDIYSHLEDLADEGLVEDKVNHALIDIHKGRLFIRTQHEFRRKPFDCNLAEETDPTPDQDLVLR